MGFKAFNRAYWRSWSLGNGLWWDSSDIVDAHSLGAAVRAAQNVHLAGCGGEFRPEKLLQRRVRFAVNRRRCQPYRGQASPTLAPARTLCPRDHAAGELKRFLAVA
jgi:hypothetical protein